MLSCCCLLVQVSVLSFYCLSVSRDFRPNWLRLEQLSVKGWCSAVPNSSHLLCVHCSLTSDLRRRSRDSYGSRPETQRALLFVSSLYPKLLLSPFIHLLCYLFIVLHQHLSAITVLAELSLSF